MFVVVCSCLYVLCCVVIVTFVLCRLMFVCFALCPGRVMCSLVGPRNVRQLRSNGASTVWRGLVQCSVTGMLDVPTVKKGQ